MFSVVGVRVALRHPRLCQRRLTIWHHQGVPQRVIHGAADDVVPVSISRGYVEAAHRAGDEATLTEPPGAGHFELIDPRSQAWSAVRERTLSLVK